MPTRIITIKKKSTAAQPSGGEAVVEVDYATLIYLHYNQRREREAVAAAAAAIQKNSVVTTASSTACDDTLTTNNVREKEATAKTKLISSCEKDVAPKQATLQKRHRKICSAEGCTNRVVNGGVCVRHGAKTRRCSNDGCTHKAVNGGLCQSHGAKKILCSKDGCTNQVQIGGVCRRHGAKRKLCSMEGCTNVAQRGGVCERHGAILLNGMHKPCLKRGECMRHADKVQGQSM
jgi:hypothetical protein